MLLSRRLVMAGLLSNAAVAPHAWAEAPPSSVRPVPRGADPRKRNLATGESLVARANLNGRVGYAVADAATGEILEARAPHTGLPPASSAKALTALYALDRLGAAHRFETRLIATGPVENGVIKGDLILAGGGDPTLDTDALSEMVAGLTEGGITAVEGGLRYWNGALPRVAEVDIEQPDHVGYNPTITGLNLNYNRVHFGWTREGQGYDVTMDARSGRSTPEVTVARMQVVDRTLPVYTYQQGADYDDWTVARAALGSGGARWLPVRFPGLYAGEVFEVLARARGISFGAPLGPAESDAGDVLVTHQSAALAPILRDMLKYSNNLTAEVVGLAASQARGAPVDGLPQSAERMNGWLNENLGTGAMALEDHSGLGDDSRVSPADMVRAMVAAKREDALKPLLKPFDMRDVGDFDVAAKTGTLNFVSALAGFIDGGRGRELAFAIFCADLDRRDGLSMAERERPEGGRTWNANAKLLQRRLINRWGVLYDA